jgi:hypothetical protein
MEIAMSVLYDVLKFMHVMSFVFMSVPLFNLIVVNERALYSRSFDYSVDRFMENILRHGAYRCFIFQSTALLTGLLLLIFGPLGITALWTDIIILTKTILLLTLTSLLSYVHLKLQPHIDKLLAGFGPDAPVSESPWINLKAYRTKRKRLAFLSFCCYHRDHLGLAGLRQIPCGSYGGADRISGLVCVESQQNSYSIRLDLKTSTDAGRLNDQPEEQP